MKYFIIPALLVLLILNACEKADPVIPNEEELITTLIYRLEPLGSGDVVELKFQDLDGDGGNDPIFTTSPLSANTSYHASITLLNELVNPAQNITEEVEAEAEDHQLFYVANKADLAIEYQDSDQDGNRVGLITALDTYSASSGTLTIVLRHEPIKPNDGSPENGGGETDIEVTFDIVIQ